MKNRLIQEKEKPKGGSMKKLRAFMKFVVILAIGIVGTYLIMSDTRYMVAPTSLPVSTEKSEKVEKLLVKWVYDHSNRISMAACEEIVKESIKTNKPLLLLALIEVESNFVPSATSNKGAVGLTQVMFDIHKEGLVKLGIVKDKRDLYDIIPSVRAGNFVVDACLARSKGDVPKALEYYLGGRDGVYMNKILSNLANLYILTHM